MEISALAGRLLQKRASAFASFASFCLKTLGLLLSHKFSYADHKPLKAHVL